MGGFLEIVHGPRTAPRRTAINRAHVVSVKRCAEDVEVEMTTHLLTIRMEADAGHAFWKLVDALNASDALVVEVTR